MSVIEVEGLSKVFYHYKSQLRRSLGFAVPKLRTKLGEPFFALKDLNFRIEAGESIGLVGRNGSGKSTFLKILCAVAQPTSGFVKHEGKIAALLELGAGFNVELSGRENIFLTATIHGISRKEILTQLPSILEFAGIGDLIEQPVKFYSSGMFARLAFAVASHLRADIFVVDEALSVGDAKFQLRCLQKMRELQASGRTLLFVSHDTAMLNNFTSRAIWLERGEVKYDGVTVEATKRYISETVYGLGTSGSFEKTATLETRAQFGGTVAKITRIEIFNVQGGQPQYQFRGGESLRLEMTFDTSTKIDLMGIGFQFKDGLGNPVFGGNNYVSNVPLPPVGPGRYKIRVSFKLPLIANGTYFGSIALSNGTQLTHEQLHWIHDALVIEIANHELRFSIGHRVIVEEPIRFETTKCGESEHD